MLADLYWVRDTALTYQYLVRLYEGGNSSLETLFFDYVNETRKLQHVESWSGGFHNGGIGEPKCWVWIYGANKQVLFERNPIFGVVSLP